MTSAPAPYAAAVTTPPSSPEPRPLRGRGTLVALILIMLFLVSGLGFALWKQWERSHPGDFTADPHYCELVSPQTVYRLVPTSYGGRLDKGSCSWSAPREKGSPRDGIFLQAGRLTEDLAVKHLREERGNLLGWEKNAPENVSGIGDEAFIRFRTPDPEGKHPAVAAVDFRLSNLVVTVTYTRPDTDREAARAGAIEAAREASDHLKASVR